MIGRRRELPGHLRAPHEAFQAVLEAGPAFPGAVHDAGLLLGTWITDDPAEAVALVRAGVDAVATNDPRAVVAAVAEAALS